MKCPSCETGELLNSYLDDLFPCKTCNHCGGNWLLLADYLRWKDSHADAAIPPEDVNIELTESKKALLCPSTGSVMLKYRISKQSSHRLDLSPAVNGIWLDKGEWDLLKKNGLAHQLNAIFTATWQKKIRSESSADVFDQLYREKFGETDYEKIKEIRAWLQKNPHIDALRAFLISDDPWSVSK